MSLSFKLIPTAGEEALQQRFQLLLDDSSHELDVVATRVAELWRLLAVFRENTPLLNDVKLILSRCDQVAELVNRSVDLKFLEEHCKQLQSLVHRVKIADFKFQPLAVPLQALTDIYKRAFAEIKRSDIPLTVKAKLYIPGRGHFLISQLVARQLGSVTEWGQKIKGASNGSNCVAHLHNVFYKCNPKGEYGFSPALEAAVVSFHELVEGESAAPTSCVKLRNVETKKLKPVGEADEVTRNLLYVASQDPERFLVTHPESFQQEMEKQEYVLQAGLGIYGAPLDLVLSAQQWVEIFQKTYGDKALEALFDDQLIEKMRKSYGAIFQGDGIDAQKLLKLFFGEVYSLPEEERLVDFNKMDISDRGLQQQFENFLARSEPLAGVWALALVTQYPQVLKGLELGNLFNWYKGMCWLKKVMPEDSIPARIDFARNWQSHLDKDSSALAIVSTLITIPKDGRADNYILALPCGDDLKPLPFPQGEIPPLRIVSIDNDISLQPPYHRGNLGLYAQLQSVLLQLKRVMQFPLSEKVKNKLLSRSAEDWILEWLKHPFHKEGEFLSWQQEKLLSTEDIINCGAAGVDHPCGIDPRVTGLMYSSLKKVLEIIRKENVTLSELFQAVYPDLFEHYQAIKEQGLDPMTSYHLIKRTTLKEIENPPAFEVELRPVRESVAVLAKQFPWNENVETVLRWLELLGRMGLQDRCLTQEQAQKLLPLAIRKSLPGAISVLCAHEVESVIDASTQQTVFHLFAHTYTDDTLSDEEAHSMWKNLISLPGSNVNARDGRDKTPSFILLEGMAIKPDRGASLLLEGIKQGLDLKISYNEETLFMRALRIAESEESFREVVHRLIPLGAAQFTSPFHLKSYLHKTGDHISQELLLQHEPALAWHFTLDALAPPLTAISPRGTYPLTTATESRSLTANLTKTLQTMLSGQDTSTQQAYGRHLVFPYQEKSHTVHIKVFPEAPGYEYAVKELFSVLFEEELPEHSLWRVETPQGVTPLLCSQTVPGDNLHTLYKDDPLEAHHSLSQLDEDHFANLLCGTIFSLPEDGKPDNFILNGRRLVGIDNDHAFIRPITYQEKDGILIPVLHLKSIILCLDQMQHPLSERVVKKIQKWPIGDLLRLWLERLDQQHEAFEKQFNKDKALRKQWVNNKKTVVGILFEGRTFPELYDRVQKLHRLLCQEPKLTGFALLQKMLPTVYPFYQAIFNQFNHPVERFYKGIAEGRYGQSSNGKITTLTASLSLLSTQGLLEKSWYNPNPSQTPKHALNQFRALQQEHREIFGVQTKIQRGDVKALLQLISPRNREKVINQLDFKTLKKREQTQLLNILTDPKTGSGYRKLRIKGSTLSDAQLLSLLKLSADLEELVLSDCPLLTQTSIGQIGLLAPHLQKVYLHRLPNLREISLHSSRFFRSATKLLLLTRCRHIQIEECPNLASLHLRTPVLQILKIKDCPRLDYTPVMTNLTDVPYLTHLDLPVLPKEHLQSLLFALNRQKRHRALIQVLEKAFPGPQNELSLPGLNMTECMEEMIPLLQRVQPKILNLASTNVRPEGVAALIKASLYPTWIAFDGRVKVLENTVGTLVKDRVSTCHQLSDGRILSGSADTLKVWDPVTFQCLATLKGHEGSVYTCHQLSDRRILSGSHDETLKVWDPVTFQCLATLKGHEGLVYTCCQLSDGRILSGSGDNTLKVWDLATFQCLATLKGHEGPIYTCCQLSDGRILSGSKDKTLKVWDPVTFKCLATLKGHEGSVYTCRELSDGKILSGSPDNTLKVWDPVTFQCLATIKGHKGPVYTCRELSDGKILSGSADNTLKVWDPVAFQCLATLKGHKGLVSTCEQLSDGRILSGSFDGTLKMWDMATASPLQLEALKMLKGAFSWAEGDGYLFLLWKSDSEKAESFWKELLARFGLGEKEIYQEIIPEGKLVITKGRTKRLSVLLETLQPSQGLSLSSLTMPLITQGGAIRLIKAIHHLQHLELPLKLARTLVHTLPRKLATLTMPVGVNGKIKGIVSFMRHENWVLTCHQFSDGRILSGSGDGTLKVWNPVTFQCLATLKGHENWVRTCYQLSDGRILSGSGDTTLKVWDSATFDCLATLKGHESPVHTCYQLSDGRILSGSHDETLKVWDPVTFQCLATLKGHEGLVYACCQLSDGRILSGSGDNTLKVWDLATFQCLATFKGHEGPIYTCCQLSDGRILSGSEDKTLKVWDPVTFQCLATLRGHEGPVLTCYQLLDGRILSGSRDKTLKVWNPVFFKCLETLKGHEGPVDTCYQLSDGRILSGSYDRTLKVWEVPYERRTLQFDQLSALADQVLWRKGKMMGPRGADMRAWQKQLEQFLGVMLPGVRITPEGNNEFAVEGLGGLSDEKIKTVISPFIGRGVSKNREIVT